MIKPFILIQAVITLFYTSCADDKQVKQETEYLRYVGDITHNPKIDDEKFEACHGDDFILQYFNLGEGPVYAGEKPALIETFKTKYKPVTGKGQNGLIRIRFIVNCEGRAGRFRVLESDLNFQELDFHKKVISQLTKITKEIKEWVILYEDGTPVDYYYYLIFKMEDGQITEILP